ncbi:hypothetical protein QCA50_007781 [Cerrena zonata]|uniref:Uncharacterized protein n=1 Tax=Cerrena zonata TaxID=2478898 RepID=A0AAW0GD65_9APHY
MTFPFTDEELDAAGLLGEGNSPFVLQAMKTMREHPELLSLSLFTLKCMNDSGHTPPTINPASSATLSINLDTTDVSPCIVSDWERTTYYNGISTEHPELLYRSDLLENPFPIPTGRHPHLPTKTVCGVFSTPLNTVWDIVAPQICELLKTRKIRYSVIKTARFVTHCEDGKDTLGPVVIWIATHPTTTTAQNAHDASPDILSLLRAHGVEDVVVEWYEGAVERLSGPSLLRVADITNPTHYVRRHFTAALGMPIATAEREGSVTLFFHENKNKDGTPSTRVFGVSNCHVLRKNTSVKYEFKGTDEPPQYVQLAGRRRFSRGLAEIKTAISRHGSDANLLATTIVELQAMPKSEDPEQVEENEVAIKSRRENLIKVQKDMKILEAFYKEIENQWSDPDIPKRTIGHVHWAPEISVDTQGHKYTKDIGTFEVDPVKFKAHFKGNVIDLGTKFTHHELTAMFYPLSDSRTVFKYPTGPPVQDQQLSLA